MGVGTSEYVGRMIFYGDGFSLSWFPYPHENIPISDTREDCSTTGNCSLHYLLEDDPQESAEGIQDD
jgi:hypothetical protein